MEKDLELKIMEAIDEWTENNELETSVDMERELALKIIEIVKILLPKDK